MFFAKKAPRQTNDAAWLKRMQEIIPDAILCMESRTLDECKTISAAVRLDTKTQTTSVFVNVSLAWLTDLRVGGVVPELNMTEERPRLPQLIISGDSMEQLNTVCEARILLVLPENKATYICFPWTPDRMEPLKATRRWLFWSLADQRADRDPFYFGFGGFESADDFHQYANDLFKDA